MAGEGQARQEYYFTLRDVDGNDATVSFRRFDNDTQTQAGYRTISNAMNAVIGPLTNAKVVQRSVSFLVDEAQGVGTDAEFPLVSQKARLYFSNSFGSRASMAIPAPLEAIFRAPPSDDIVDPTNALVASFIAAYESNAMDAGDNLLNLFQGGALSSHSRSRRRSIHS